MNPYASFMGERSPMDTISETPRRVAELLDSLGPDRIDRSPNPGKWSARDIVAHLADCELVFGFRLRQTLAEDHHVCQPFDQDLWAKAYAAADAQIALAALTALRAWNIALIKCVSPAEMAKPMTHPERGTMTFQTVVETMAGHDRNHIKQIEAIAFEPRAAASS
jgi:hypothetical protein